MKRCRTCDWWRNKKGGWCEYIYLQACLNERVGTMANECPGNSEACKWFEQKEGE